MLPFVPVTIAGIPFRPRFRIFSTLSSKSDSMHLVWSNPEHKSKEEVRRHALPTLLPSLAPA